MIFIGLDVGTSGARAVACGADGTIIAGAKRDLQGTDIVPDSRGRFEQPPESWRKAAIECLSGVGGELDAKGIARDSLSAISVTSTSGTLVAVGRCGAAVGPAIMYNDLRASAESGVCNEAGAELVGKLGYSFNPSFTLPKLLHALRVQTDIYGGAAWFGSPADYLNTVLCGTRTPTDQTNALKLGYDLIENRWPDFIINELGIARDLLPDVTTPGTLIGMLCSEIAELTGLPRGTPIAAGMTDGCASQVAAGALAPGQWSSTIGTTLVIKGVTREILLDPQGAIYCHRHPMSYWLPGGASNVGADCVTKRFGGEDLERLGREALAASPSALTIYPLERKGERYPFRRDDAEGFVIGEARSRGELFAGYLEGVAHVERLAYERLMELGAEVGGEILVSGGGTNSDAWLQIRADVLNKALLKPAAAFAAMGAAALAASQTAFGNIVEAARAMIRMEKRIEPRRELSSAYDDQHERFLEALRKRGYIG